MYASNLKKYLQERLNRNILTLKRLRLVNYDREKILKQIHDIETSLEDILEKFKSDKSDLDCVPERGGVDQVQKAGSPTEERVARSTQITIESETEQGDTSVKHADKEVVPGRTKDGVLLNQRRSQRIRRSHPISGQPKMSKMEFSSLKTNSICPPNNMSKPKLLNLEGNKCVLDGKNGGPPYVNNYKESSKRDHGLSADRNILLMGTSGCGKSATGNSILGRDLFQTSDGTVSQKEGIDHKSIEEGGMTITVFDGLTLPDERVSESKAKDVAFNLFKTCRDICPEGVDLLVFVLSYDSRATREERIAVATLKKILGDEKFSEHCVIVFTHGENFLSRQQCQHIKPLFKEWIKNIKDPVLREITSDFGNKAFLFCNDNQVLRKESIEQFFKAVNRTPRERIFR